MNVEEENELQNYFFSLSYSRRRDVTWQMRFFLVVLVHEIVKTKVLVKQLPHALKRK